MENLLSAIEAVRQKFGATMSDDECALLCNEVAWKHRSTGWGLSGKTSGTRGHLPNGTEIAHDILHHQPTNTIIDILVGAGAQATPTWNVLGAQTNLQNRPWVAPIDPASFGVKPTPTPTPTPAPTPTAPPSASPSDAEATRNALKALAADVAALRTEILRGADASVRVEESLKRGLPVRIKTFIGKIVGTVGGN